MDIASRLIKSTKQKCRAKYNCNRIYQGYMTSDGIYHPKHKFKKGKQKINVKDAWRKGEEFTWELFCGCTYILTNKNKRYVVEQELFRHDFEVI